MSSLTYLVMPTTYHMTNFSFQSDLIHSEIMMYIILCVSFIV